MAVVEGTARILDQETGEILNPTTSSELAMVRTERAIKPALKPDELKAAIVLWNELKTAVLSSEDYQSIGTDENGNQKSFIKKSGWNKLSQAFAVSTEIVDRLIERDQEGQIIAATITVRAIAPNGKYAEGVGSVDIFEARFADERARKKLGHDVIATAATRARNRACSDLFGFGELSAEEMAQARPVGSQRAPQVIPDGVERPDCPVHGKPMALRTRKSDGNRFWGCPQKDPSKPRGWCDQTIPFREPGSLAQMSAAAHGDPQAEDQELPPDFFPED